MIKVMIVDDQRLLLDLLSHMLKNTPDIDVVACGKDGFQAIALAQEFQPDVILMDIQMPNCDGIEATRRIKQHHPDMKILILSSSKEDQDVHQALTGGADGYVLKNIGENELVSVIRSVYANMEVLHEDVKSAALRSRMGEFEEGVGKTIVVEGVRVEIGRAHV